MVKRILKKAPGEVRFCYEAGVCGFNLKCKIEALCCKCAVIAPFLTPVKPGERIKTDQPQQAIDITDRAGQRLRKRYWYFVNHGKMPCKANAAVARELAGFIWSVLREYQSRSMEKVA